MPVLLAVLTFLGAAVFWFYRMRDVGHAVHGAVDAAQRLRGTIRRKRFLAKAESSPIAAVEDPAAAAVATLVALASCKAPLSDGTEAVIKAKIRDVMGLPNLEETFIFAKWVASHAASPNELSFRFEKLWAEALDAGERASLYEMASDIARLDGGPNAEQIGSLKLLRQRLGLT